MAAPREHVIEQALTLRKEDRAELAGVLIRSLEPAPEAGVDEAWREEIERRAREIETGAVKTVSWESVRGRLMRPPRG
jgi:putative addiction module component (TIGR02574 family)